MDPKCNRCILVSKSLRETHNAEEETHRSRRGGVIAEVEAGVMQPQVGECRQTPKSGKGKKLVLPWSPIGSAALPTL